MTQAKRQLRSERLRALWIEPALHRQVAVVAALEGKQMGEIATEALSILLATKQTPVDLLPKVPDASADSN